MKFIRLAAVQFVRLDAKVPDCIIQYPGVEVRVALAPGQLPAEPDSTVLVDALYHFAASACLN